MKKIFLLGLLILFVFSGCNKFSNNEKPENPDPEGIQVSEDFNWRMARTINFDIKNTIETLLKITSLDQSVIYYKGTHPGDNMNYNVRISIPYTVNNVLVNGVECDITSGQVQLNELADFGNTGPEIEGYSGIKGVDLTNYCLSFDGIDDYVDLGDISELNNVAAFTIEGWANQANVTATETIFSKLDDGNNDIIITSVGGRLDIHLGNGTNSFGYWGNYSTEISNNTWFHWAIVFDGGSVANADKLKLYINGNTTPKVLAFIGAIPSTTSSGLSGNNAILSTTYFFTGFMDEVRIWSDVRTPTEITDNYNKIISPSSANLVANWRMDEGSGTTLYDETTSDYDATINGCTWALYVNSWDSDGDGVTDLNDDYEMDATRAHDNYFPAAGTGTLVFEDLWPSYGDFDFNDLVMGYRFKTVTNASDEVVEIFATFTTRANGAYFHNGFGFELPDAVDGIKTNVVVTGYSHTQGIITIDGTTKLESGQTNPVVIVIDDISDILGLGTNTHNGLPYVTPVSTTITMTVSGGGPFTAANFSLDTWNPFIFVNQVRGREVHLLDYAPTDLVDVAYFNTYDDASVPATNDYYKSSNDLPWALDIPIEFEYAFERIYMPNAYLHFVEWAESEGTLFTDWYSNTAAGYRNNSNIYTAP
ncbi:MAG: LruC domain-containing protein [Bacteroidales bacterium]|nr:LruC domain-containing protein [Bacteroidales bacterium]